MGWIRACYGRRNDPRTYRGRKLSLNLTEVPNTVPVGELEERAAAFFEMRLVRYQAVLL